MGLMNTDVSVLAFVGVRRFTSLSGFAFLPSPSGGGMPRCHTDFKIPPSPFLRIQRLVSSLYLIFLHVFLSLSSLLHRYALILSLLLPDYF